MMYDLLRRAFERTSTVFASGIPTAEKFHERPPFYTYEKKPHDCF